jgi:hypothetical protein
MTPLESTVVSRARQQVKSELATGFMHDLSLAARIAVVRNSFLGTDLNALVAALAEPPATMPRDEPEQYEDAIKAELDWAGGPGCT